MELIDQAEIHKKALSDIPEERVEAARILGLAYPELPDQITAEEDLTRLALTSDISFPNIDNIDLDRYTARWEERGPRAGPHPSYYEGILEKNKKEKIENIKVLANFL
jgi:hypothetical protein